MDVVLIAVVAIAVYVIGIPLLHRISELVGNVFDMLQNKLEIQAHRDAVELAKLQNKVKTESEHVVTYEVIGDDDDWEED